MSYSERVLYDRYSVKDPEAELKPGDIVVVTQQEEDPYTGKVRDSRHVGIVRSGNGQVFDVALKHSAEKDNDREVLKDWPRHLLEYVVEKEYDPICVRMSEGAVANEPDNDEFKKALYDATSNMEFIPAGRILAGLGRDQSFDLTLFNCYVFDIPGDSRDAIGKHWLRLLNTFATGGGVGWNLSTLRPRGSLVKKVNGRSSGAVSWGEQFSQVTGAVEQGGCFGASTLISTTEGLLRADDLADRIEEGDVVYAQTHKGPSQITTAFRNGEKRLYRVKTSKGYTVEVSADHKMGVLVEGRVKTKALRELKEGDETLLLISERWREEGQKPSYDSPYLNPVKYDRSVMSTNLNTDVHMPTSMTPELAYFLGYSYGDGYVLSGKKVNWVGDKGLSLAVPNDRPEVTDLLLNCITSTFNVNPTVESGDGACVNVKVFSRLIIEWLRQNGLLKQKSEDLQFPLYFTKVSRQLAGAFVSGYFDADGSDRKMKGGYGFDSVSKPMLESLQVLLASFGVPSRIGKQDRSEEGWRDLYRLTVTGAIFKQRMSRFLWMSTKDEQQLDSKRDCSHYPIEVFSVRKPKSKYYAGAVATPGPYVSYRALCRVRDRLLAGGETDQAQSYEEVLQTLPDEIVTIEPLEQEEVYDFEVADVHMLSGNGFYTSNSRRGASLQGMWCWHPDIEEFIEAKSLYEKGMTKEGEWINVHGKVLSNSNVSVMISDDFMEAVEYNSKWDLVFPDTSHPDYDETWDGDLWKWQRDSKPVLVYRTINARDLWDKIVLHAWRSGEPGLLFLERANKMSNSYYYDRVSCTNPCVTGDTLVMVWEEGKDPNEVPIHTLVGKNNLKVGVDNRELPHEEAIEHSMVSTDGIACDVATTVVHSGKKPVWKLSLEGRVNSTAHKVASPVSTLRLTGDHKIRTTRGMVAAQELRIGDKVHVVGGTTAPVVSCFNSGQKEDVYDVVNTTTHTFIANGIVVSNCGEQPLPKNSVCNLSHVNLAKFIKEGTEQFPDVERTSVDAEKKINWPRLKQVIHTGVRFLDNCIDLNKYHDPETEKQQMKERRIGLGVLGFGELLMRLGLGYGSHEGLKFTDAVFKFISSESYLASVELAKERGAFESFDAEKFLQSGFMRKHAPNVIKAVKKHGIRNVTLNTVAPTGSVGTLADTTTGIEPYFALKWTATTRIGMAEEKMSVLASIVSKFGEDEENWPSYVVTAQKGISPAQHVKTQAMAQRWIDSSISKTVNLPKGSTKEDVSNAYIAMWRQGCKGGTVYVDQSRDEQVLHVDGTASSDDNTIEVRATYTDITQVLLPPLKSGIGPTFSLSLPGGNSAHMTIRCDGVSGEPYDLFINAGKGEMAANAQALARMISTILRWPNNEFVPQKLRLDMIRGQLYKIPGRSQEGFGPDAIVSFPDAVAKAISKFLEGDYPLSTMPLGLNQLEELIGALAEYDIPEDVLDKLFRNGHQNSNDDETVDPSEQVVKDFEEEEDTERYSKDVCLSCNGLGWVQIPNKCSHCVICGYKEC